MSENVKCTHIPRVRVEVDHEGMDMSWLECVVCGNRLYVSDEPTESLRTQLAAAEQEKEKAWQMYERARKERADVLMLKSVEGLTMSEWQLRLAKAESELRTLRRSNVRVDVLLRYERAVRSSAKRHGVRGIDVPIDVLSAILAALTRRSLRKENT